MACRAGSESPGAMARASGGTLGSKREGPRTHTQIRQGIEQMPPYTCTREKLQRALQECSLTDGTSSAAAGAAGANGTAATVTTAGGSSSGRNQSERSELPPSAIARGASSAPRLCLQHPPDMDMDSDRMTGAGAVPPAPTHPPSPLESGRSQANCSTGSTARVVDGVRR